MRGNRPIFVVEDDDVDLMSIKRAFSELKITNPLVVARGGREAIDMCGAPDFVRPALTLLDLRMPEVDGLDVLRWLRSTEKFDAMPVVIMTTSREERDKTASFKLGIAGYIIKPVAYQAFVEAVKAIDLYWTLSEIPGEM